MCNETFGMESIPVKHMRTHTRESKYRYDVYDNNDNDKVFYSTLIIHFILHIAVINAFAY